MIVTQNIDNLHSKAQGKVYENDRKAKENKEGEPGFAFTKDIIELHGNVGYMHCFNKSCYDLNEDEDVPAKFYNSPNEAECE